MHILVKLADKEVILTQEKAKKIIEFKKGNQSYIIINGSRYHWNEVKIAPVPSEFAYPTFKPGKRKTPSKGLKTMRESAIKSGYSPIRRQ